MGEAWRGGEYECAICFRRGRRRLREQTRNPNLTWRLKRAGLPPLVYRHSGANRNVGLVGESQWHEAAVIRKHLIFSHTTISHAYYHIPLVLPIAHPSQLRKMRYFSQQFTYEYVSHPPIPVTGWSDSHLQPFMGTCHHRDVAQIPQPALLTCRISRRSRPLSQPRDGHYSYRADCWLHTEDSTVDRQGKDHSPL